MVQGWIKVRGRVRGRVRIWSWFRAGFKVRVELGFHLVTVWN